ncbi:MAG: universal stress protein [Gammaproteobacteria bacterium]
MFKRVLLCYDGSEEAVLAGAAGHACLVDEAGGHRKLLNQSVEWLKARDVVAEGFLASGNTLEQIVAFAQRLAVDLIVLGHYPQPSGGFWWGSPQRSSLAERANCCVFVAFTAPEDAPSSAQA